ncbi:hypothetical protein CEXT_773531 [Caerostris extrusa]|uniref:Uncharacterized protein n=1 Tax=Caerostris extrusa TaxID=172846 RepID=A0AAV4N2D0_CAEEX|nr:hypothetical protein CEXT_773531 [Caerostris extrusa]
MLFLQTQVERLLQANHKARLGRHQRFGRQGKETGGHHSNDEVAAARSSAAERRAARNQPPTRTKEVRAWSVPNQFEAQTGHEA